MNTLARGLIDRLMVKVLHRNPDNRDLDDVEALAYLNEATREVYRWYALYLPEFITSKYTYLAAEGESSVTLPAPFATIKKVTVNGREFMRQGPMVPMCHSLGYTYQTSGFDEIELNGIVLKNNDKVVIHYMPAEIATLRVPTVSDPLKPGETDASIFPQVWDDALIAHAHISYESARGMMADSEQAARSKWMQQVMTLYFENSQPNSVGEYWQGYAPRGDML
jgi:hypothetical protein